MKVEIFIKNRYWGEELAMKEAKEPIKVTSGRTPSCGETASWTDSSIVSGKEYQVIIRLYKK